MTSYVDQPNLPTTSTPFLLLSSMVLSLEHSDAMTKLFNTCRYSLAFVNRYLNVYCLLIQYFLILITFPSPLLIFSSSFFFPFFLSESFWRALIYVFSRSHFNNYRVIDENPAQACMFPTSSSTFSPSHLIILVSLTLFVCTISIWYASTFHHLPHPSPHSLT